jgi:hemolysin activation/secretion protein
MYHVMQTLVIVALETRQAQNIKLDNTAQFNVSAREHYPKPIIPASDQPSISDKLAEASPEDLQVSEASTINQLALEEIQIAQKQQNSPPEQNYPVFPEAVPEKQEIPATDLPADSPDVLRFPIKEFRLQGNTLLSNEEAQRRLKKYLGENKNLSDLTAAREALIEAYRQAGYSLVSISSPKRQTLEGIFQIDITEVSVGSIILNGNRYFSQNSIRAALPELQENRSPNLNSLSRQLFLANDNPSRQLTLDFKPGDEGKTNVDIKVQDQNPQRFSIRLDNTGTESSGRTRLSFITQNNNAFNIGHLAAFSVTVSPEKLDKVKQFGFFYQAPIPSWGDVINFSASYSDVNSGRIADIFDVSGQGVATGIHFLHNISRTALDRQTLDIGIDYRLFQNTIDFAGENLGVDVAALPISLGYQYTARKGNNGYSAGIRYVRNIPGLVGRNNNESYSESRVGAKADWDLFEINGTYQYTFPSGWLLNVQGEGQYAGEPLISGEQFGLGGLRSIRGLEEREAAGDNALRASIEIYTPVIGNGHRFLAFTDVGQYWREKALPGEPDNDTLWTTGLGWRWNLHNRLNTAVDLGYVLKGSAISNSGDMRVHFSLNYSF